MTTDDKWHTCQPGTIQRVAQQQKQSERQHSLSRRAMFTTVLVAGAGVAYAVARPLIYRAASAQTPLTCGETLDLAQQYLSGQLNALQDGLVETHLAKCPKCRKHIDQLSESRPA